MTKFTSPTYCTTAAAAVMKQALQSAAVDDVTATTLNT
jgi:hypothetical protein